MLAILESDLAVEVSFFFCLITQITKYLSPRDFSCICLCCKTTKESARLNELWRKRFQADFGGPHHSSNFSELYFTARKKCKPLWTYMGQSDRSLAQQKLEPTIIHNYPMAFRRVCESYPQPSEVIDFAKRLNSSKLIKSLLYIFQNAIPTSIEVFRELPKFTNSCGWNSEGPMRRAICCTQ